MYEPVMLLTLGAAILITGFGILAVRRSGNRELIQIRKGWDLMLLVLIFCLPGIVFIQQAWPAAILLAMVPASCYIGFAFGNPSRNILPVIFFWVLVAFAIYNNWFANY